MNEKLKKSKINKVLLELLDANNNDFTEALKISIETTMDLVNQINELKELPIIFAEYLNQKRWKPSSYGIHTWVKDLSPVDKYDCKTTHEILKSEEFKNYVNKYYGR